MKIFNPLTGQWLETNEANCGTGSGGFQPGNSCAGNPGYRRTKQERAIPKSGSVRRLKELSIGMTFKGSNPDQWIYSPGEKYRKIADLEEDADGFNAELVGGEFDGEKTWISPDLDVEIV